MWSKSSSGRGSGQVLQREREWTSPPVGEGVDKSFSGRGSGQVLQREREWTSPPVGEGVDKSSFAIVMYLNTVQLIQV